MAQAQAHAAAAIIVVIEQTRRRAFVFFAHDDVLVFRRPLILLLMLVMKLAWPMSAEVYMQATMGRWTSTPVRLNVSLHAHLHLSDLSLLSAFCRCSKK